jgi:hypothetical protein
MNRRNFLHLLGLGAVAAAVPKIIFDMGANLPRVDSRLWLPPGYARLTLDRETIIASMSPDYLELRRAMIQAQEVMARHYWLEAHSDGTGSLEIDNTIHNPLLLNPHRPIGLENS